jgi:hypothetical protein
MLIQGVRPRKTSHLKIKIKIRFFNVPYMIDEELHRNHILRGINEGEDFLFCWSFLEAIYIITTL